ncbi:unnamed protein product [Orchesella dallaii]|uniref:Uncharacterized protein n=1 Tax=Orchesella dallaii TaxID=48710 RepID=A0ABP1QCV6_9HEXA
MDFKTAISHKSTAKLFEIKMKLELHHIILQWKRLNVKWNLDIAYHRKYYYWLALRREERCDNMRKLYSQPVQESISIDNCIKNIVFVKHNSTHPESQKFLNFLLIFSPIFHSNGQRPYYYHRFGYHYTGHRFAYFLEHEKRNKVDILAVFKPVPLLGWVTLLSVAVCLAVLLKAFRVHENPPLVVFRMALEQSAKLNRLTFIGCVLVGLWLFACILIRNVYTSTIYSILTAKTPPILPKTLEDAIENHTDFDVVYNRRAELQLIVHSKPLISSKLVDDDLNILWRRRGQLYTCNLRIYFRYNEFLDPLAESSDIICMAHASVTLEYITKIYKPGRTWGKLILIYNTGQNFDALISIFGNRRLFEGIQNDFNVTTEGYLSSFQTIFSAFVDDDLRDLEQSGVLQRLRFEYSSLKTLWMLKDEGKRLKHKSIRGINLFTVLHQSKSLTSALRRRHNSNMKSVKLESVLVAWGLYGWMLMVCFGIIFLEILHG